MYNLADCLGAQRLHGERLGHVSRRAAAAARAAGQATRERAAKDRAWALSNQSSRT